MSQREKMTLSVHALYSHSGAPTAGEEEHKDAVRALVWRQTVDRARAGFAAEINVTLTHDAIEIARIEALSFVDAVTAASDAAGAATFIAREDCGVTDAGSVRGEVGDHTQESYSTFRHILLATTMLYILCLSGGRSRAEFPFATTRSATREVGICLSRPGHAARATVASSGDDSSDDDDEEEEEEDGHTSPNRDGVGSGEERIERAREGDGAGVIEEKGGIPYWLRSSKNNNFDHHDVGADGAHPRQYVRKLQQQQQQQEEEADTDEVARIGEAAMEEMAVLLDELWIPDS